MNRRARIFVAGGGALAGAAILDLLKERDFGVVVGAPPDEPDLTNAGQVEDFFADARPEYVILAAGMSGGIALNQARPAELMLDNLLVTAHVLDAAHRYGVTKLLYLASSCAYPKHTPQPLRVESLTTGPLEPTSEAYATAKLAGWKLCEAYRRQYGARFVTAFPANAFGPHDDFGLETGHVLAALIRRAHQAKVRGESALTVWGTGAPRREFLYARDLADACLFVLRHYDDGAPINLGGGTDLSIAEAAAVVADVVGYRGRLEFDASKPDGAPLKRLDSARLLSLGWRPSTDFRSALAETYDWFLHHEITEGRHYARQNVSALYRIRRLEEEIARVYATDKIKSPVHLSIGQEAVSVGVCEALRPEDVVFGTYRGHALYLAKGGDLKAMVAELYGRVTGCTKGKGGSMHLIDPEHGVMGMSAVVGTTIANAAGYAYALRCRRQNAVVASFFGDGATEEGVFAETLNFAVLKRLPILFVCENNKYAIHTRQDRRQGKPDICGRARAHGMPAELLDGNDLFGLVGRAREAVAHVRAGEGPWFFEVATYRWQEHVGPGRDYHLGYRSEEEAAPWLAADPLEWLAEQLDQRKRARIEEEVGDEIAAAFAFAEASPFPEAAELMSDVF